MREGNDSRQQGVGLDNGNGVEHGYGAECNGGATGGRAQQWHIEGRLRGYGSNCDSVDARQSSCGWVGSGVGAEGNGNREVEAEEGQRSHRCPSSALASVMLA